VSMTLGCLRGLPMGDPEYFDEIRLDLVSAPTWGGGPVVRANPRSKFWDFDTLYLRNPLSNPIMIILKMNLRETDLSNGKGLEAIRV